MRSLRSFFSALLIPNPQTLIIPPRIIRRLLSSSTKPTTTATTRVSLYLRRARLIDSLRLRLRLQSHDPSLPFPLPSSPFLDSFVAAQTLRSAPSPDSALSFFLSLSFSSPHPALLHSLAKRLSLSRRLSDLHSLLESLNASPIDRLRWLATAGDLPSSLLIWSSIRSAASSARRHPCTEAYNLIIGLYASNGSNSAAVATFSQMVAEGANPNSRTYTIIIDHLVRSGNLDPAMEIFSLLPSMRIRHTSKQYNILADALSSAARFDDLQSLIKEMNSDGILPGRPMREAIGKLKAAGFTEATKEFVDELSPDERIGYVIESEGETDEDNDEEENTGGDRIRLKPWMDPIALARALDGWDPTEVSDLETAGFVWTPRLVCKLLRSFKKPETAWNFFCWVSYQPGGFAHNRQTVSRMIAILARTGHVELVDRLLSKLESERVLLPFATVRLVIDFYGLSKKADAAIRLYRNAGSICGPLTQSNRILLCSSLLRTVVKSKRKYEAMELLEEMMLDGVLLDLQTFSGLMLYFAEEGDLKSVHKLFGLVRQCRLEPDGYMYRVLIRAYCKNERAALGLRVFEEMRGLGLVPDGGTKGLLVKSLWQEGKLREAALVEERCEGVEEGLPVVLPVHVWTVSVANFRRVCEIYFGCFKER